MPWRPLSFSLTIWGELTHFPVISHSHAQPWRLSPEPLLCGFQGRVKASLKILFENVYFSWFLSLSMGPLNHTFINIAIKESLEPHTSCWNVWIICSALREVKWTDFSFISVWMSPPLSSLSVGRSWQQRWRHSSCDDRKPPKAFAMNQVCPWELSGNRLRTLGIDTQFVPQVFSSFTFSWELYFILFYFLSRIPHAWSIVHRTDLTCQWHYKTS